MNRYVLAISLLSATSSSISERAAGASSDWPVEIHMEEELNDKCRGGSGDDPQTMQACEQRDQVVKKLESMGWCYGLPGQPAYERKWRRCNGPKLNPGSKPAKRAGPNSEKKNSDNDTVDYSKPIYTKRYAVICPIDIFFDRRASRSSDAAEEAALAIFDREEKLRAVGCEEWRGGIRLYIQSSQKGRVWQSFSLHPEAPADGLYVMGYDITNQM